MSFFFSRSFSYLFIISGSHLNRMAFPSLNSYAGIKWHHLILPVGDSRLVTIPLEKMRIISRLVHFFPNEISQNRALVAPTSSRLKSLQYCLRTYSLPAKQSEDDEEVEMFDPRKLPADYDPSNFDPTEHRSPPTNRVFRLVDEIAGLTLSEVSELSMILMKKLNMKEPPVVGVMKVGAVSMARKATGGGGAKEEKKPEKTVFELKLEKYDAASKIKIVKEVRSFTDLGLKEAKDLVEKAPAVIKSGVSKEEAEQIIEKMKAIGATVVME